MSGLTGCWFGSLRSPRANNRARTSAEADNAESGRLSAGGRSERLDVAVKPGVDRLPMNLAAGWSGYLVRLTAIARRVLRGPGRTLVPVFDPARRAGAPCTRRWTFPTWPAKFFSTCSRQTTRQGQSLFGHFSKRANCSRRSRTNEFSRCNSASSLVASRDLPFIIMNLKRYTTLPGGSCHLLRRGFLKKSS